MTPPRRELERKWVERLKQARLVYEVARGEVAAARTEWRDGCIPRPDGAFAANKAIRAETAAIVEYTRVVKIFNDLVIRGIMPPED